MEPIIKISIVLIVMVIIISRKIDLTYALLAGIVLTGILFNHGFGILNDLYLTITDITVLKLFIMFFFVFFLSSLLSYSGTLKKMLTAMERVVKDVRVVIITMPFMIGLVPAPSGAILSAPFVEEVGNKAKMKPEKMMVLNYWFRHVTEYINPLMPGVILLLAIIGISFKELFFLNMPIMIFAFLLGYLFYASKLKNVKLNKEKAKKGDFKKIFNGILPLLIAILLPIIFKIEMVYSLPLAVLLVIIMNKIKLKKMPLLIRKSIKIDIFIMIFLIIIFKNVLEQSKAIEQVANSFIQYGFPPIVLIIVIPLLMGLLTGITFAYVGLGFPLIMPFLKPLGTIDFGFVMLAFVSGFIGVLASPTHLCFSVTQKYFKTSYNKAYKLLMPSLILLFTFALVLTLIGWPIF